MDVNALAHLILQYNKAPTPDLFDETMHSIMTHSHLIDKLVKWGNYNSTILMFLLQNDLFRRAGFQFKQEDCADLIRVCIRQGNHSVLMQHLLANIDGQVIPIQYFMTCIEIAVADAIVKDNAFNLDMLAMFVRTRNQALNLAEIRRHVRMLLSSASASASASSAEARLQEWLRITR